MNLQIPRRLSRRAWRAAVAAAQGEDPERTFDLLAGGLAHLVRRKTFRAAPGVGYTMSNGRLAKAR